MSEYHTGYPFQKLKVMYAKSLWNINCHNLNAMYLKILDQLLYGRIRN